jgi:CII-binding regulator of phage lambda lysogenization HflD
MTNLLELLKANIWKVSTVIFAFLFLLKGCTNNKISNMEKKYDTNYTELSLKLDSLQTQLSKTSTSKQVKDEMERIMFDFLIYEDDLDKGKTNLSNIKNKIESND